MLIFFSYLYFPLSTIHFDRRKHRITWVLTFVFSVRSFLRTKLVFLRDIFVFHFILSETSVLKKLSVTQMYSYNPVSSLHFGIYLIKKIIVLFCQI